MNGSRKNETVQAAGQEHAGTREVDARRRGRMRAFRAAFPLTLPVMAGYLFLGITYGILMVSQGLPAFLPVITAAVIYTGSMEFLLADILVSSFNPLSAFATALMVGARHIFYGLSLLDTYRDMGWKKFYLIYTTSDETFAVNYSADLPDDMDHGWFYFWVSLLDQAYWIIGSAVGALCGTLITFRTEGLDFVMTAMFVTIFMNQWLKDSKSARLSGQSSPDSRDGRGSRSGWFWSHAGEWVGLGASVLCLLVFGPDRFIVPTMVLILIVLTILRPYLDEHAERRHETPGMTSGINGRTMRKRRSGDEAEAGQGDSAERRGNDESA